MQPVDFNQRSFFTEEELDQVNRFAQQLTGKKPTISPTGMTPASDIYNPIYYIDFGVVMETEGPLPFEQAASIQYVKDNPHLGYNQEDALLCCLPCNKYIYGIQLVNNQVEIKPRCRPRNKYTVSISILKTQDNKFYVEKIDNELKFQQVCDSLQEALQIFKQQSADILNTWQ